MAVAGYDGFGHIALLGLLLLESHHGHTRSANGVCVCVGDHRSLKRKTCFP